MLDYFKRLKCLTLFTLFLAQVACAALSGPLSGTVIDMSTGKPIEGAVVVAHWKGDVAAPAHSQSMCYHVESATTDGKGRFNIPTFVGGPWYVVNTNSYVAGVYKEGYREVTYKDKQVPGFQNAPEGVVYLIPFIGSPNERLAYLKKAVLKLSCSEGGESQKNEFQLFKTFYEEAKELVSTKNDDGTLQWFREIAAGAWVGASGDMPMEEYESKVNDFLKSNLK